MQAAQRQGRAIGPAGILTRRQVSVAARQRILPESNFRCRDVGRLDPCISWRLQQFQTSLVKILHTGNVGIIPFLRCGLIVGGPGEVDVQGCFRVLSSGQRFKCKQRPMAVRKVPRVAIDRAMMNGDPSRHMQAALASRTGSQSESCR
jgi:hypothetical protein